MKKILLSAITGLLLLSACGSDEKALSASKLVGTWLGTCTVEGSGAIKWASQIGHEFQADGTYNALQVTYRGESCSSKTSVQRTSGKFTVSGNKLNVARDNTLFILILDETAAESYNLNKMGGYTDWKVGEEKSVMGRGTFSYPVGMDFQGRVFELDGAYLRIPPPEGILLEPAVFTKQD